MKVEFDPLKAATNIRKHGVALAEAAESLLDPEALVREDDRSVGERRFLLVGMSGEERLLTVCYTLPDETTIRVISARRRTPRERRQYAQGI